MSCPFYKYIDGYYCYKKHGEINEDVYSRYCRDYSYSDCPIYKDEKLSNIKKVEKYILEYNDKIEKEIIEYNKKISNFTKVELECPYCGESIKFGQEQCYNCEEDLFWPDI